MTRQALAQQLLDELDAGRLEVCKVRGREGGYIRVVVEVNAEWYRQFCRQWEAPRRRYPKPRTIIKRCHTRRGLEKIANGGGKGVYVERLTNFIDEEVDSETQTQGGSGE